MEKQNGIASVYVNNPRVINGWAMFDWANSSFALVITVAIFPAYFLHVTEDTIPILGADISNSSVYSFSIAASYILIAAASPLLSGIADYAGRRKLFLRLFTTLGSLACMSLFFFQIDVEKNWMIGIGGFMLANIGFAGSLVFYNAYLPDIVTEDRYDRVSAKGFSYGYIGSVLLLIASMVIIQKPGWFGLSGNYPILVSFVLVGLWWIGFAQITFRRMPPDRPGRLPASLLKKGYREIMKVWQNVRQEGNLLRFLWAFFFYSAGVQTILYLASSFAEKELDFETTELILIVLILQIVAIGGAYGFAWLSDRKGNKFSLMAMLVIWITICAGAYLTETKPMFYVIAALVGLVMGGIQSLSRSTYSKLIPRKTRDTTSYFSFYDVLEKLAIVFGTFSFGLIDQLSGGMRNSLIALALFFLIGIVLLSRVTIHHMKEKVEVK